MDKKVFLKTLKIVQILKQNLFYKIFQKLF